MLRRPVLIMAAFTLPSWAAGQAMPFLSGDTLSVYRLGDGVSTLANRATAAFIDEYVISPNGAATLRQTIPFPTSGPLAFSNTGTTGGRDGLLTRSTDGRFLLLAGYRRDVGLSNPLILPSWDSDGNPATPFAHRVVGLVAADGTVDTRTTLRETGDNTAFRGVASDNGSRLWLAVDNNGGTTLTGGTRYVTRQPTTTAVNTVNLSQRQSFGSPTPDNIRSVHIYGGQLYNSSGSNSSVGSDAFTVGTGLPLTGSQTLTPITDGFRSVSSFFLIDADANTATGNPGGFDVMYAVGSNQVMKLIWDPTPLPGQPLGHFASFEGDEVSEGIGYIGYATGIAARQIAGGAVELFLSTSRGIYRHIDPNPLAPVFTDDFGPPIAEADGVRKAFRGIAFSPYTSPFVPVDLRWAATGSTWSANPNDLHFLDPARNVLVPFGQGTGAAAGSGDRVSFGSAETPLGSTTITVGLSGVTPSALHASVAPGATARFAEGSIRVAQNLTKSGPGTLVIDHLASAGNLELLGGTLRLGSSDATAPIVLGSVSIDPGTFLDLTGNDLIVRSGSVVAIRNLVRTFLTAAGGLPSSSGVGSSLVFYSAEGALTTLAVYDNAITGHTLSSFGGIPVNPTDVLVKYTYLGDTNLDGLVDAADLARILQGLNSGGTLGGWNFGDLNYDGIVDFGDLGRALAALRGQGSPLVHPPGGGGSPIPEPASLGLLVPAALVIQRRARRA